MMKLWKHFTPLNLYHSSNYHSSIKVRDIFLRNDIRKSVKVQGWIKALRKMKDNVFIDLNDGTYHKSLQLVLPTSQMSADLTYGASVEANGSLSINDRNQIEFKTDSIKVIGSCSNSNGYPFAPKVMYTDDYLRQYLHLRPRTNKFSSLLRIRNHCRTAVHSSYLNHGFIQIDTPILTSNDCEGAGEVFKIIPEDQTLVTSKPSSENSYFDVKTFLTVSGQLHLEVVARSLSQVYCFGPTFRAENSKSRLHLSEFYMVEAETSYVSTTTDLTKLVECLIKEVTKYLLDTCSEDIAIYNKFDSGQQKLSAENINNILSFDFTVMSYEEAYNILVKHKDALETGCEKGASFTKEHELYLIKVNNNKPLFIVEWPKAIKPFYMKSCTDDRSKVMAFDLLCPVVGEVCGGSLREDDFALLETSLAALKLSDKLDWYLDLRKFGNVLTGGYGLGFERLLQVLLGTNNIKDTIPFPRWPHNCKL